MAAPGFKLFDELYKDGKSAARSVDCAEDVELLMSAAGGSCSAEVEVAVSKSSAAVMTTEFV